MRWWIIAALSDIWDMRAVPALKKMLYDKSAVVTGWAAVILNGFPGTNVEADLEGALEKIKGESKASQHRRKAFEKALDRIRERNAKQG